MKVPLSALVLFGSLSLGSLARADAPSCPSEGTRYPFYCRGKLSLTVGEWGGGHFDMSMLLVHFSKNSQKAGIAGINLAVGTCAWGDRPMTPTEPISGYTKIQAGDQASQTFQAAVIHCASDISCVLQFNATNCGNGNLWIDPVDVSVWYPHG